MEIETKIQDLRKKLNDHNYHYYVLNDPIISDSEYDELLRLLQDIEQKNPNLVTLLSIPHHSFFPPLKTFLIITRVPILSNKRPANIKA